MRASPLLCLALLACGGPPPPTSTPFVPPPRLTAPPPTAPTPPPFGHPEALEAACRGAHVEARQRGFDWLVAQPDRARAARDLFTLNARECLPGPQIPPAYAAQLGPRLIAALLGLGEAGRLEALRRLKEEGWGHRALAVEALGRFGRPEDLIEIAALLRLPGGNNVCTQAAEALARGGAQAVPLLLDALPYPDAYWLGYVGALEAIAEGEGDRFDARRAAMYDEDDAHPMLSDGQIKRLRALAKRWPEQARAIRRAIKRMWRMERAREARCAGVLRYTRPRPTIATRSVPAGLHLRPVRCTQGGRRVKLHGKTLWLEVMANPDRRDRRVGRRVIATGVLFEDGVNPEGKPVTISALATRKIRAQ